MIIIAVMLLGLGVVMILIALSTLLSATSTLVKYHQLAKIPPPAPLVPDDSGPPEAA